MSPQRCRVLPKASRVPVWKGHEVGKLYKSQCTELCLETRNKITWQPIVVIPNHLCHGGLSSKFRQHHSQVFACQTASGVFDGKVFAP